MFPLYGCIIALIIEMANNNMKRFKQFLLESPAPPNVQRVKDYIWKEETQGNENKIRKVYYPQENDPTIAGGHSFKDLEHSRRVFAEVFPEKMKENPNWVDQLAQGTANMEDDEMKKLFDHDVEIRLKNLPKLIKNLNDMSPEMQEVLASSYYRGSLGGSPETVRLLNAGKYKEAADEYVRNAEYEASRTQTPHPKTKIVPGKGVYQRMDREREVMLGELERQSKMMQALNQNITKPSANTGMVIGGDARSLSMSGELSYPAGKSIYHFEKPVSEKPKEQKENNIEYTVKPGDNLTKIAQANNKNLQDIIKLNNILDPNKISVGQKIKLPK